MSISVIICTYRRVDSVRSLLGCLAAQDFRDFEVVVVDGSGDRSPEREALRCLIADMSGCINIRFVVSEKGLTRQRNRGMAEARGDLLAFLDDDVTFGVDFLSRAAALMDLPEMRDVGGMSAYDTRNYGQAVSQRWKLRSRMKIVPQLVPGSIDRLGRSIPFSLAQPFSGCKTVGYLYGFCMIYRREAVAGLQFDEELPTYAGEDRDFSARVARRWRLVLCGDLPIEHHCSPQSRDTYVQRTYQAGFGTGRSLRMYAELPSDYLELARVLAGEFLIDTIALLKSPSRERALMPLARAGGLLAGWKSMARRMGAAR